MPITAENGLFSLTTDDSLYQMKVDAYGVLNHTWYGPNTHMDMEYLEDYPEISFSGNPWEARLSRLYSLNDRTLEYPGAGISDYRTPAVSVIHTDGSSSLDLRYESHTISHEKYTLPGLPASFERSGSIPTLRITLRDMVHQIHVHLLYAVFEHENVIARSVQIENSSDDPIILEKVSSFSLDFPSGDFDVIHFQGRHAMERLMERTHLGHGEFSIASRRGHSSHQHNPAIILSETSTTETTGQAYGFALLYSGSFEAEVQMDQLDQVRVCMGIEPSGFSWILHKGESFYAPEALLSYSADGLGKLSRQFHDMFREHVIRSQFVHKPRPVLINNWEATYFDFDGKKLLEIADAASSAGMDMLVLDDGWFGKRNSDFEGLGDWEVNEAKLGMSLPSLIEQVHDRGLKFGLWIEPEMISEDSELFRAHPDWVMNIPTRLPSRSRSQLVLDLANPEVVDYLHDVFSRLLRENHIDYIKWDMNRSISDFYSKPLPPMQQRETAHRYILGVYDLADRLTSEFPDVLFEGCAGGGGRMDGGMLYYFPQYWCSDNTDAHCRTFIQHGTSFFYPISAVGSHVSAVPNHQTGRVTSLHTRGVAATPGTFGYELDLTRLSQEELDEIRQQTETYRSRQQMIFDGDYYRLSDPSSGIASWQIAEKDGSRILVQSIVFERKPNTRKPRVFLQGLPEKALYRHISSGRIYSAQALMHGGILLGDRMETDAAYEDEFIRVQPEETEQNETDVTDTKK